MTFICERQEAQVLCDQMSKLFVQYWPFTAMNIFQWHKIFAKVGLKFCQVLNKHTKTLKSCPKWLIFAKSRHTAQRPLICFLSS